MELESVADEIGKRVRGGKVVYFCPDCGLLTRYRVRREITEVELRDAFSGKVLETNSWHDEEIECPECGGRVEEIEETGRLIERLETFVLEHEEEGGAELERLVLSKLRK